MKSKINQKIKIKNQIIFLWGLAGMLLFYGCQKEVSSTVLDSESYIRTITSKGNQSSWLIKPTDDKGFLLIATEDDISKLIILKINENGQTVSKDTINGFDVYAPIITALSDGSILICSGYDNGNLCKLDKNGKVIFTTNFGGTKIANSYPTVLKDGTYAIASAFSWGPGTYSLINFVKPDGTNNGQVKINDASFGLKFKTLYTCLHRCDTIGTYYFNGFCFPNWNSSYTSRAKLFIAKQKYSGNTLVYNKTIIIDSANQNYSVSGVYQVNTSDKHTLLAASFLNINNLNKGRIIKLDADLNSVWKRDLLVGFATYCTGISECADGNYLVMGVCFVDKKSANQPFACKIDKNGNILWQKIFNTKLYGQFSWGEQVADGSCIFAGSSNGFGKGTNLSDLIIMKTDKDGNL